jgi:hypothetical protein
MDNWQIELVIDNLCDILPMEREQGFKCQKIMPTHLVYAAHATRRNGLSLKG